MPRVEVVFVSAPHAADECTVSLGEGATLFDALRASGVLQRHPGIDLEHHAVGIWGERKPLDEKLRDGDRVEVYRALNVDPMEARRRRAGKSASATCSPKR